KDKVLLAPAVTQCAIPKGIFGRSKGAMLRMIAYGPELNLAHPPRPTDVKITWEPEWAVRVRTKSTAMAMLGQSMDGGSRMGEARTDGAQASAGARPRPDCPPPASGDGTAAAVGSALGGSVGRAVGGALSGLFGKKEEKKEPAPADCPQ
ncbi:MAG: hypothetical protein MUC86_05980, partial [Burkholderiaceae bacterium]|nr:hypothetical protein [Burkholderiaceae bacterium]